MNSQYPALNCRRVSYSDSATEFGSAEKVPLVAVDTVHCRALVSPLGAQVLSFAPRGDSDWLWLSPQTRFAAGQAIRGGIPLCLPWFGVNRRDKSLPKHGFLRSREWQLLGADELPDGGVSLAFATSSTDEELALFPWRYKVRVEMVFKDSLSLRLSVSNTSASPMPLSFAMHSYLAVNELDAVRVRGLKGCSYLDNSDGLRIKTLGGEQCFDGEVDRVFESIRSDQYIDDGLRGLKVSGEGCDTVIVWNPGEALANKMADVGEGYTQYICVERGRAFADELEVAPGANWDAVMSLSRTAAG